jgi:glyoxylate reductase
MRIVGRVFITRAFPFAALERLRAEHEVDVWDENRPPPRDVLLERAANADALLTIITERVDAELFDAAPSVKAVANLAVGTDNIDLDEAARRGIPVGNTPGVLTDATADIAFALLLGIARRITEGERQVREGRWEPWYPTHMVGGDTTGTTLGIVGWGRIGQAMARRGEGFGMEVIHHSRSSGVPLDELLERSDHVSLHTPLTADTRHLIGAPELRRMKRTAYLINTARGGVVDQVALREALEQGEIAGAGLDVTDPEPLPKDDPLLQAPNLLVVPHVGSATTRTRSRMAEMAVDNLLAALAGRDMPHRAG